MQDVEYEVGSEENVVTRWRFQELERAGFDRSTAELLAAAPHVDLHEAVELITRGCPPATAGRILL